MGGGVLLTSIHTLDYLRWLFGEVKEVMAEVTRVGPLEMDVEDVVAGVCRLESGGLVGVWIDFLQRYNEHRIQVTGEDGDLTCIVREDRIVRLGPGPNDSVTEELPPGGLVEMYVSELRAFLDAVRKRGGHSPVPLEDGIRALELARAFRESGETGRRVRVRREAAASRPTR
jgi:predicted dehydrogenase